MQRLPAVLQNEIWTYVHGDRAFWKTQYDQVVIHLLGAIQLAEDDTIFRHVSTTKSSAIIANQARFHIYKDKEFLTFLPFKRRFAFFCDIETDYDEMAHAWFKYEQLFLS